MEYIQALLCNLSLIFFFILQIILTTSSQPVYTNCSITPNKYTINSLFHQNLKIVLNNLTLFATITSNSSFQNSSFGLNDDVVYGISLCRGDVTPKECSSCINNATTSIVGQCPGSKESIVWYDECMLRYANRNILFKEEESPKHLTTSSFITSPPPNVSDSALPEDFTRVSVSKILYDLINETAFGESDSLTSRRFFSVREDNITRSWYSIMIYSLAQCTPDITELMCRKCLAQAYTYVEGIIMATVYLPSCHLRYGDYKFFNSTNLVIHSSRSNSTLPSTNLNPSLHPGQGDPKQGGSLSIKVIAIVVPLGILTVLLISGLCIFWWRRKVKDGIITMESLQYDINTIKTAVNNFSDDNKLGHGGFGDVFKGRLQNGQDIAVKRLSPKSKQGVEEFKAEVLLVAKLQHRNLVRLLGFCATTKEKLLIYEYLPYSSLDRILFDPEKSANLGWETRYKIIDGVARGLQYLHQDSRYKIVHRDLKPSNILLDKDMNPKISDFGLAKLFEEDQTQDVTNRVVGTLGYMAPEYIRTKQFSTKSDVYSFGILVLEILSGRRIRPGRIFDTSEPVESLLQRAWRLWHDEKPLALMDPKLNGNFSAEEATRCIHIGVSCTQEEDKRPTMASVVSVLSSHSNNLPQLPRAQDDLRSASSTTIEVHYQFSYNAYSGMEDNTTLTGR